LTEISRALAIHKSTCFVILQTLHAHNFVNYDEETKKYSLGWALAELGGILIDTTDYVLLARKFLGKIVKETSCTCCIWQRISPHRVILLDKIEDPEATRLTLSLGTRVPITVGAMGKCFLAFDENQERKRLVRSELRPYTPKSIMDVQKYLEEVEEVQKKGWAKDFEGHTLGINAVASPIFNREGKILFIPSLIIRATDFHMQKMDIYCQRIHEIAKEMTHFIGGKFL
jgi:DNA-binding IclR family transcriptional regulator